MHKDLITLKQITQPIIEDVKIFQGEFENALNSDVRLINTISKYMIKNKGKNITRSMTEDVYFEMISQKTASLN